MTYDAHSIDDYISQLPEERKEVITKLRTILTENLPAGFSEAINYKMPSFVVSHDTYPGGYHCDPKLPLPFISYASQKNFVALYHMGIYANPELMEWFTAEYPKHCKRKLDMGKSCIRFKKMDDIPYDLIAELATKMSPQDWIDIYEANVKKK
ncbi:DUF1801 domain-containing protein [uncultured Kordia sp.]|uniref:DUF1801 domain-containing protein n=1 Tax=uncultured Kordia sp. TaxID=507699 RepID=UPI00262BC3BA|nr:DUF1801 domain-containing protein [uncultured Kordia sp.]